MHLDQLKRDLLEFLGAADPGVTEDDYDALLQSAVAAGIALDVSFPDALTFWRMIEQLRQNGLPEDLRL